MEIDYIELIKLRNNFRMVKMALQIDADRFDSKTLGCYWPDASKSCTYYINEYIKPSIKKIDKLLDDYRTNEMLKGINHEEAQVQQVQTL